MDTVTVRKKCKVCGDFAEVKVLARDYAHWQNGELIQRAFPEMPPEEREMLLTGTHPACWEILYPSADEPESYI